mgnify:FL=1
MKKIIIQLDKSTLLIKRSDTFKLNLSHNDLYEVNEENDSLIIKETKKSIFKKAKVELIINDKLDSLDITCTNDIELEDIEVVQLNINGDVNNIELNNVTSIISNISTTIGDVYIKSSKIEQLAINSDEGDLLINIKGNEEDYHIECAGMGDRKLAHNFLKLNSDGNIDYTFEL